jgi:hypothetical protein
MQSSRHKNHVLNPSVPWLSRGRWWWKGIERTWDMETVHFNKVLRLVIMNTDAEGLRSGWRKRVYMSFVPRIALHRTTFHRQPRHPFLHTNATRTPFISSPSVDRRRLSNVKNIHETFKSCGVCPPDIDFYVHLCAHWHRVIG